jgi:23S rRNA (guanosine2251-2'-O)-methyltransferase
MSIYVVLHNIRSAHNVGSIFRTADGAGVAKVFLCGFTPDPIDRFGRVVPEIKKTSLGATESIPWEHVDDIHECMDALRAEGVTLIAIEQHEKAIPYDEALVPNQVAFIFGNEIEGVPATLCELAGMVVAIPMSGKKESLNVSVCAGIVLFEARRKQKGG